MQVMQVKNNEIQKNPVEMFLETFKKSENTKRNYDCDLRHFFNVKNIKEITLWQILKTKHEDVQNWIVSMFEEGKSDNTIKRRLSSVRSFYEYCEDMKICKNPINTRQIEKLLKRNLKKQEEVKGTALTKEEINRLLEVTKNKKHKVMFKLMFQTAVRVSELVNIKKEDFEYHNGFWFVKIEGKGRKVRYIPLKEETFRMVEEYMDEYNIESGRIFKVTEWAVNKALNRVAKLAGLKHISSHDGRRTAITGLIKNGANMVEVQNFAGHASMTTTRSYFRDYEKYNVGVLSKIDW